MSGPAVRKEVYHIKDLPNGNKSMWIKIGSAFVNKDGSINAFLDTLPIDGRLHIRDPRKTTKEQEICSEN
jgi:hypothetical protein